VLDFENNYRARVARTVSTPHSPSTWYVEVTCENEHLAPTKVGWVQLEYGRADTSSAITMNGWKLESAVDQSGTTLHKNVY